MKTLSIIGIIVFALCCGVVLFCSEEEDLDNYYHQEEM
jgi:hypothetical protein